MKFLSRSIGTDVKLSRTRNGNGNSRRPRVRALIGVESLEGRELLSGDIPGVSMQYGAIDITATQTDHNTARVAIDPANGDVQVSLNGQAVEYNASDVFTVNYTGGSQGHDSFVNDTSLTEKVTMYGNYNSSLGGSTWNTLYLYGDYDSYDARNGASYVYAYHGYDGMTDDITPYDNVSVFPSLYDPSWFTNIVTS
jgi:hypothetical protein